MELIATKQLIDHNVKIKGAALRKFRDGYSAGKRKDGTAKYYPPKLKENIHYQIKKNRVFYTLVGVDELLKIQTALEVKAKKDNTSFQW